ncbi:MAG: peptidoglycan-binding domain-containing protein [Hyphomicrobiaceae bacterium]
MLGIGVIANIFSSQQQHAARSGAEVVAGQTVATKRTIAGTRNDQKAKARRRLSAVRRELESRGYLTTPEADPTGVDIKAAILAFEFDHNLQLTALPSEAVLKALIFTHTATGGARRVRPQTAAARELVGEVQRALAHLGYGQPNITAELDTATRKAIRKFERARGLQVSGRVSAPLVARLGPAFDATQVGHVEEAGDPNAG